MHERKALMAELSDAFVALPGGIGTLEELIEVYTWSYLGIHSKPLAVLNTAGFYDGLSAFLDHAIGEGFLRPEHRARLLVAPDTEALLAAWHVAVRDVRRFARRSGLSVTRWSPSA